MSAPPAELVCIGDVSRDTLVSLDHLPKRDEKQWANLIGEFQGGMAANVAVTYARLGGSVRLVAHVGRDERGAASLEALRQTAVDISGVTEVEHPTFWTLSLIDAAGERSMVEFASPAIHPAWSSIGDMSGARAAYTIGSETQSALKAFRELQADGLWTAVDADYAEVDSLGALHDLLRHTTVFFCNSETAFGLTGLRPPLEAARRLADEGPRTVVVTLGRMGALAVDRDEGTALVHGFELAVVDSTGAGDCFAGAFLYARLRDWPLKASVELANLVAAVSTTTYGCQSGVPTRAEVLAMPQASHAGFDSLLAR